MKIVVGILEKDIDYLQKITVGLNKKYADKIEVHVYSDLESALSDVNNSKIKLLVMSSDFTDCVKLLPAFCTPVCFSEANDVETINGMRAIGKYQKIETIYKQLVYIYSENCQEITLKGIGGAKSSCIAFMSPSGGVGSSTVAAAVAQYLTRHGKKTLYVSLETFGVTDIFFSGDGQFDFGNVIYELKKGNKNFRMKLESVVRQDKQGVYYIQQPRVCMDMMELSHENIITLIEELRFGTDYEYIILDMDFSLSRNAYEIYQHIDRIILVGDGSELSNEKLLNVREAYRILDRSNNAPLEGKIDFLYNRFVSKTGHVIDDLNVLGGIPVIQAAKTSQIVQQIAGMDVFSCLL